MPQENWISFSRDYEGAVEIIGVDIEAQSLEEELPAVFVVRAIVPERALQENRFPNRQTLDVLATLYDGINRNFVERGWLPWASDARLRPIARLNRAVSSGPAIREMAYAAKGPDVGKVFREWIAKHAPSGSFALEVVDGSWTRHFQPLLPNRFEIHNSDVAQLLFQIAESGEDMEAPHEREHMLVPSSSEADPEGAAHALREAGFLDVRTERNDDGILLFCVSNDPLLPRTIAPVDAQLIEIADRFGMDYDGFEVGPLGPPK